MATAGRPYTAQELLYTPELDRRYELVRGRLIERSFGDHRYGLVTSNVALLLSPFAEGRDAGVLLLATGFWIEQNPDTVQAPSLAYLSKVKVGVLPLNDDYPQATPDLAIEVVTPWDTAYYLQAKVEQWLTAGVPVVWVVYPNTQSVVVFNARREARVLTGDETLAGDPILPGFSCKVSEFFS